MTFYPRDRRVRSFHASARRSVSLERRLKFGTHQCTVPWSRSLLEWPSSVHFSAFHGTLNCLRFINVGRPTVLSFFEGIVFSCDQAALWMVQSVCLSVRPSHLFDYVPIIVSSRNFQELLPMTKVTSMQKVKVRGQGHRGKKTRRIWPRLGISGL